MISQTSAHMLSPPEWIRVIVFKTEILHFLATNFSLLLFCILVNSNVTLLPIAYVKMSLLFFTYLSSIDFISRRFHDSFLWKSIDITSSRYYHQLFRSQGWNLPGKNTGVGCHSLLQLTPSLFSFKKIYWSIVDLECGTSCCTAKWFNYTYIYSF